MPLGHKTRRCSSTYRPYAQSVSHTARPGLLLAVRHLLTSSRSSATPRPASRITSRRKCPKTSLQALLLLQPLQALRLWAATLTSGLLVWLCLGTRTRTAAAHRPHLAALSSFPNSRCSIPCLASVVHSRPEATFFCKHTRVLPMQLTVFRLQIFDGPTSEVSQLSASFDPFSAFFTAADTKIFSAAARRARPLQESAANQCA